MIIYNFKCSLNKISDIGINTVKPYKKKINLYNYVVDLKQALNEIKEYITKTIIYEDLGDGYCYNCDEYDEKVLLQIIDKALGDE